MDFGDYVSSVPIKDCVVGQEYWIDVTHVNNPHSFFVRLIDFRMDIDILEECGKPVEDSEVTIGRVVIYLSGTLRKHVRGLVYFIHWHNVMKCDLKAIDYGCTDIGVPTSKIYKPKTPSKMVPLAIHCKLANCVPLNTDIWEAKTTEAMLTYIGKERTKMIVKNKMYNQLSVDLINSCPDDIATMLAYTNYSSLSFGNEISISRLRAPMPQLIEPEFKCLNLHIDEVLHVRVQSGKTLDSFFVARTYDFKQYSLDHSDFTAYCKSKRVIVDEEIEVGNLVAYKSLSGTAYERAVILELIKPGNKLRLQKIDWGDIVTATQMELKPITCDMYINKPAMAIYCSTGKSVIWDNGLHKFLYPGFEFMIKIKELGDGFNKPNVVDVFPVNT